MERLTPPEPITVPCCAGADDFLRVQYLGTKTAAVHVSEDGIVTTVLLDRVAARAVIAALAALGEVTP